MAVPRGGREVLCRAHAFNCPDDVGDAAELHEAHSLGHNTAFYCRYALEQRVSSLEP